MTLSTMTLSTVTRHCTGTDNSEAMEAMEACRQTKRKRYSAVGETEVDQEELLQSAKKRSREDVDDEVGGWRDVDDELDGWRDDLDKSF